MIIGSRHDWKSCVVDETIAGSSPVYSASFVGQVQ